MSDRTELAGHRRAILNAAAAVVAAGQQLSVRNVTAELGTSTMAVYTYFGGVPGMRDALRDATFEALGDRLASVPVTTDAVADLSVVGRVYTVNAIEHAALYRLLFADPAPRAASVSPIRQPVAATVQRCIDDERFRIGDADTITTQLWIMTHGLVGLAHAGALGAEVVLDHLGAMATNLYVSFGDDPARARKSIASARRRQVLVGSLDLAAVS